MRERKRILDQWLRRLEAEKGLIEGAILEINRRLAVPGEVEGWNPADYTSTDQMEFDSLRHLTCRSKAESLLGL